MQDSRPTHFIALQLSHCPGVRNAIEKVQAALVAHCAELEGALVDPGTAHLSLLMLKLAIPGDDGDGALASHLLALRPALTAAGLLHPITVQLRGLSHFDHKVLSLEVDPAAGGGRAQLDALAAATLAHFQVPDALWSVSSDHGAFSPHVTVAKLSKLRRPPKKKRKKPPETSTVLSGVDEPHPPTALAGIGEVHTPTGLMDERHPAEEVPAVASACLAGVGGGEGHLPEDSPPEDCAALVDVDVRCLPKQIPPEAYAALVGVDGGEVQLREVQLCVMQERAGPGEYYTVRERVSLEVGV